MSTAKTLVDFDAELASANLHGQWNADALLTRLTDGPRPIGTPFVWRWSEIRPKLDEACIHLPESFTARRNFTFVTPQLPRRGTTPTLIMGVQLVLPGEIAWAHRHSIGALRFVVEGNPQLCTVVEGNAYTMEPNDLVLTPSWAWHDHHNEGDRPGIWIDVLDVPLIAGLNQTFYEPFGESMQPRRSIADGEPPPLRFAWRDVEPELRALGTENATGFDGTRFAYTAPATGASVLPTMACYVQRLAPGFEGLAHRHTASTVYFVITGKGTVVVDDSPLEWDMHDSFAVPSWSTHRLINGSSNDEALLFSVTDEPLMAALGLQREESR